jgi:selenide, water dikinase
MQWRLRQELSALGRHPDELKFHLFTSGAHILPTHNAGVRARFERVLRERGVVLHVNAEVTQVGPGLLQTQAGPHGAGEQLQADEIVFVTRAGGAPWLRDTGLELDADGCLRVTDTLQSTRDPLIFAAGDVAAMVNFKLEKAGVFAVRMGKPLAANLRRAVAGQALQPYHPQRTWLALISTGGQNAVASKGALGLGGTGTTGNLLWRWKDWIDRRFMRKFSEFPDMSAASGTTHSGAGRGQPERQVALNAEESLQAISAMRCGGCGAKVGATVLSRALGQLHPVERDDVLIGLKDPDDAAVVRVPPGKAMVHSVDFFRAFVDDPYVFGQVAANHALGDIWAMGGEAQSATAVVTVPPGLEAKTEDVLFQMMSGAMAVLKDANCALVGGHTGEGKELALGFAVNGLIDDAGESRDAFRASGVLRKGGMRPGDVLILTKPIGTGTLFAAHARMEAGNPVKGRWIQAALDSMVISNRVGAQVLRAHGATAATDLTGFGLLGHLVEMTRPSEVDAELCMSELPILDGAEECVKSGIVSSLQSANVRLRRALRNQEAWVQHPRYPLIFDPQTAGGLLASVPADRVDACVAELKATGYPHTAIIGRILPQGDALEPITLAD